MGAKREQAKYEALIASLSDGIIVRNQKLQITKVNPALTDMLGYSEDELQGLKINEAVEIKHISGRPLLAKELTANKDLKPNDPIGSSYVWTKKDGSKIIVEAVTSPYIIDGVPAGTVTIVHDISERAAIDEAKTEFVSLAAHQLRTPLSSINWYLEMLAADSSGKLSPRQKDYLSEIQIANQRMVTLVNDLLNVSRIDLGTFSIKPEPIDIEQLIRTVLNELRDQIATKALHITTAFSGPIDHYLSDPQLALIIFQNLIGNAVKYTPADGSIDIYAILDSQKLLITIDDTGYGIPRSQQEKIFTKLFRADNVVLRDTDGTGLGLYLVKAIIEKSGGSIDFVSKLNQGTTFSVIFPSSGMKSQSSGQELAATRKRQPQKIK